MSFRLLKKTIRVLSSRPAEFFSNARGTLLFVCTRGKIFFLRPSGIQLGKNVRLQKTSCLSAERPNAKIKIGAHSVIYEFAQIAAYGKGAIEIGERAIIGDVRIYARNKITIGARSIFSWNVFMQDFQPHPLDPSLRAKQLISMTDHFFPSFNGHKAANPPMEWDFPTEPIHLGDDLWFGANCTILPGVTIGNGSIIAAGAVVVRGEYPPNSVLAGNPAKVVKTLK